MKKIISLTIFFIVQIGLAQDYGFLIITKVDREAHANIFNANIITDSPEIYGSIGHRSSGNVGKVYYDFVELNNNFNVAKVYLSSHWVSHNSNDSCESDDSFTYTRNEFINNLVGSNSTDCNFFTIIYPIHIVEPSKNEYCYEDEIILKYGYHWQFSFDGINWVNFPNSLNSKRIVSFTLVDLFTLSGISENVWKTKSNIKFRSGYSNSFTNIRNINILNCSPKLVGNPQPISPTCSNSVNTIDNNNGSFTATINRELDDTRQEKMKIEVWDLVNGVWDGFESKVIEKNDFNGRSYTWTPRNLPSGTYKLFWQTKSNNVPFDNANSTPDKFGESPSFVLTTPPILSVSGIPTNVQCVGGNDGSITVTPFGGTPPYQYSINGGNLQSTTLFENLTKGDYTITIQDNKGCQTYSSVITINERFPDKPRVIPLIVKNPTLIDGNNGSISFSVSGGSGNYTNYTWTKDGNSFTPSATSTNTNLKDLFEGTYTIVITDSNGCTSDTEEFILIDPLPIEITIRMTPDTVDCSYTQVNLIASAIEGYLEPDGEYSYLWNDGSTDATLVNVGIGDYEVTVTDDGGNSQKKQFKVEGPNPIIVTSSGKKELSCRDGNDAGIQLDIQGGTGDYVIIWKNLLDPDFSAFGKTLENVGFGSYIYRVTDEKGCFVTNSSQPIEFINPSLFTIDLGEDPFFCEGQIVTISAKIQDPLATYNWTSSTGFTSTEPVIRVDQEGKYTATVISGKGCIAVDTIMVTENVKEITAEFLYASQVFTNEKMVIIDVTYPIPNKIEWVLPDEAQILQQNQDLVELSFDTPGTYEVTLISKLGNCQDTYTQKIVVLQGEKLNDPNEDIQTSSIANIQKFSVYPNPSNGQFSVKVELKEQKEISIKIFNLADNVLLAKEKHTEKKEYEIPFTIQVAAGVYAIVLETPYGNAIRKIVVK
ncbi:T9SS type A sorting domain-containing protein [Aquimarina muelleri]|uniref:T9SS type A sorting domain-containing protein n=1 Tax=Aquimarina muelleri TaxID=279356 RepID=UPI003F68863D